MRRLSIDDAVTTFACVAVAAGVIAIAFFGFPRRPQPPRASCATLLGIARNSGDSLYVALSRADCFTAR